MVDPVVNLWQVVVQRLYKDLETHTGGRSQGK
jgi:hypothetical protein